MNLNNFFNDLAANSSRNYKIEQLEKNKNNEILKEVIRLALDPFTQFYIRKIPAYVTSRPVWRPLDIMIKELSKLSTRQVTGNAGIEHLKQVLSSVSPDDAKVIERIIAKDLKCGVQVSTANAVWTGLVSEYPTMLCSQYEKKLVDKIKFPAMVQTKMDGMRFNAIVRSGKVEYRSRNGKEINLLGNLDDDFVRLSNGRDFVFDGELLVDSTSGLLDRQTGNGILNKAVKGTITEEEAKCVRATLWDMIPFEDFQKGKFELPYYIRHGGLMISLAANSCTKVGLVDTWEVNNLEEAQELFQELLQSGQEGIILKDKSGIWEDKRSKSQIKFKGELECDLEILEVEEGTGKYAGRLGAIVCSSRSEDGKRLTVAVGSGFNDAQRDNLWSIRDSLIGKIVAVKYNERIKNKQGEESLFLPIFVELREDKDSADSIGDIK